MAPRPTADPVDVPPAAGPPAGQAGGYPYSLQRGLAAYLAVEELPRRKLGIQVMCGTLHAANAFINTYNPSHRHPL